MIGVLFKKNHHIYSISESDDDVCVVVRVGDDDNISIVV